MEDELGRRFYFNIANTDISKIITDFSELQKDKNMVLEEIELKALYRDLYYFIGMTDHHMYKIYTVSRDSGKEINEDDKASFIAGLQKRATYSSMLQILESEYGINPPSSELPSVRIAPQYPIIKENNTIRSEAQDLEMKGAISLDMSLHSFEDVSSCQVNINVQNDKQTKIPDKMYHGTENKEVTADNIGGERHGVYKPRDGITYWTFSERVATDFAKMHTKNNEDINVITKQINSEDSCYITHTTDGGLAFMYQDALYSLSKSGVRYLISAR